MSDGPVRPKVMFAIPSTEMWDADFGLCFGMMTAQSMPYVAEGFANLKSYDPVLARNNLVKGFLEHPDQLDWLLFLDTDMVYPADSLIRLLKHQKPIIAGLYRRRLPPHDVLGVSVDDHPIAVEDKGLVQMKRLPTGMLLIHRSVLETMSYPWFRSALMVLDNGKPQLSEGHGPLVVTEDYWFSDRAIEAGFELWADLDLTRQIGHCAKTIVGWEGVRQ